MSDNPAGWQDDPTGKHDHRYWDGTEWTDNVADAGVASQDPYDPDVPTVVTPVSSDETMQYPATGAPSPYVPPTPVATGGEGTGGRSKSGLAIGVAILAAIAVAVIAFLAFGGDDDEPTAPLADESTSTTQADDDDRGEETLEGLRDACADGDFEACDLLYISAERGSDLEVFGGTCGGIAAPQAGACEATNGGETIPGGFSPEDLMATYGIDEEQAECVAEHIADAIRDGELDVEQGLSNIFEVAAECDISIEEFEG